MMAFWVLLLSHPPLLKDERGRRRVEAKRVMLCVERG
jgi:hypothetical protein